MNLQREKERETNQVIREVEIRKIKAAITSDAKGGSRRQARGNPPQPGAPLKRVQRIFSQLVYTKFKIVGFGSY